MPKPKTKEEYKKVMSQYEDKQIRFAIRVPQDLKDEFTDMCHAIGTNPSCEIRRMITQWIKEMKS